MKIATAVIVALVALEHLWFLILEMFLWEHSIGLRTFAMTPEYATITASIAKNQGLYNGFLVAGLFWSFLMKDIAQQKSVRYFFFSCIVIAGIFGGFTIASKIFFVQAVPAIIGIILCKLDSRN